MNENLDGVLNALLHNEREAARTFKVGDEAKRLRREDIVKKRRNTTWINLGKMDYDSEESSTDETIVKNMIEDHFFQITKKGKDEKQKEDSIEEDRTNKDTVKWYPKKKRNRTKVNPQKKLLKEIDVHEDPETKIARAIAEEAEKKKIRENEARKKKEQKWIELGQAVCSLSADDFILPSDVAENPDHKPDRSQRGEPIVVAVASFIQSMKALVGNKAAHDTVLADQSGIAAALCGIHKSALTARFSFKKSKFD
ncbi:Protein CBG26324 [Caenorhabditis briggsae]|uniref:Protein CBG26324 n=1 Tax=Caenorhabditis briggsae TaxID=6238 RepID=B6IG96_CAEBR|nr:Protein CBG26324 [Caenorhabditis briggsae]CAR98926.1 Protein CBG26324 [Caenorhabditis briggsae]